MSGLMIIAAVHWFAWAAPAASEDVVLTFDDLPTLQLNDSTTYAATTTDELLGGRLWILICVKVDLGQG